MSLANDPIMSERLIWLFRHLECQNLSIISVFIDSWGKRGVSAITGYLIYMKKDFTKSVKFNKAASFENT